jgi:hypothetical protein
VSDGVRGQTMKFIKASIVLLLFVSSGCISFGTTKNIKHEIKERADGGYTIILSGTIRGLIPITAEGFFPKKDIYYQIELKGTGKDSRYENLPGSYYSYPDNIECMRLWGQVLKYKN